MGQGGVGQVWLAHDMRLDRPVAMKLLNPSLTPDVGTERFGREARAQANLSHPGIVQIYDVGRDERGFRYIVSEFIDGMDLATIISKGRVNLGWGLHVAKQVVEGIQALHTHGIVHRDIKPSNILVDARYDRAKLTDFGLAKSTDSLFTITGEGAVVGTPAYMAPEQLEGKEVTYASDIYSLGATLYHFLSGAQPRNTTNLKTMVFEALTYRPRPLTEVRPDIPVEVSKVIARMLQPNVVDRLSSLQELVEVLNVASKTSPLTKGQTLLDRAIEVRETRLREDSVTQVGGESAPTGFFDSAVFPKSQFFGDAAVRFSKIQETLTFYRNHLNGEYETLQRQAKLTYWLWLGCVGLGFLVLLGGVGAMLAGKIKEGVATAAASTLVFFIQRVFQQREDYYRSLAKSKNSHLEYGNHWLLVIQSIDSITDQSERAKRQARLVEVLTDKLGTPPS
jgi:serine/threonine protein kinase